MGGELVERHVPAHRSTRVRRDAVMGHHHLGSATDRLELDDDSGDLRMPGGHAGLGRREHAARFVGHALGIDEPVGRVDLDVFAGEPHRHLAVRCLHLHGNQALAPDGDATPDTPETSTQLDETVKKLDGINDSDDTSGNCEVDEPQASQESPTFGHSLYERTVVATTSHVETEVDSSSVINKNDGNHVLPISVVDDNGPTSKVEQIDSE